MKKGIVVLVIGVVLVLNIRVVRGNDYIGVSLTKSGMHEDIVEYIDSKTIEVDNKEVFAKDIGVSYLTIGKQGGLVNPKNMKDLPRYFNIEQRLTNQVTDKSKFKQYFSDLNKNRVDSEDASVEITDTDIKLHKEKLGNKINVSKLYNEVSSNKHLESVDTSKYLIKPEKTTKTFRSNKKQIKEFKKLTIAYTNGYQITYKDLLPYAMLDDENNLVFEVASLYEYLSGVLRENLKSYNTVGVSRPFTTSSGTRIQVIGGTYGDEVDFSTELDSVMGLITSFQTSTDREPSKTLDLPDDIGNTYVEVSIPSQHLWFYKGGVLQMETDIVSGTSGKHDTPRGTYYISEKINGKYLVGDSYRTWVNKWMRLTNMGVGLHDATWRHSFGGGIYTKSGSHGCINLPYDFACRLYECVESRTPVIIY